MTFFPLTRNLVGPESWEALKRAAGPEPSPREMADALARAAGRGGVPAFAGDLAALEASLWEVERGPAGRPEASADYQVNPELRLMEVEFQGLADYLADPISASPPRPGRAHLACWPDPLGGRPLLAELSDQDLLALKLAAEGTSPARAAAETGSPPGVFVRALAAGANRGLLLRPRSAIRRDKAEFPDLGRGEEFVVSDYFTLQWHITQACDLHCRHCYDRSARPAVSLERGGAVLRELAGFCRERGVAGQVSFSGGNPLLHPHFLEFYRLAHGLGLTIGVLGNPSPRADIEAMLAIARPAFFQVSLEGLAGHNDYIRGAGHFGRTLDFLAVLRDLGVYSMVMLTLTRENLDQVLPLTRVLTGRADEFNFSRLALYGQGAALALPEPDDYRRFLAGYLAEADVNPLLGLKDSLLNLTLAGQGRPLTGGCTGFGCGAAFNFLAALPDGEVHACRKMPSLVGNLDQAGLAEIYDSPAAAAYRRRSLACASCGLRTVCGGCLAVTSSLGLDPARQRDPFCLDPPLGRPA